jgi:hypothetical protein
MHKNKQGNALLLLTRTVGTSGFQGVHDMVPQAFDNGIFDCDVHLHTE